MGEQRLFNPVVERATMSPRYLAEARTAVRRARERALTAVPEPSSLGARSPGPSPSLSQGARTIGEVPRGAVTKPIAPHGTRARYNHRTQACRCPLCRQANRTYIAAYKKGEHPGSVSIRSEAEQPVSSRYL